MGEQLLGLAHESYLGELPMAVMPTVIAIAGLLCTNPWRTTGTTASLIHADHAGGELTGDT